MAKDEKPKDLMRYDLLQQEALRGVVRAALKRAASPQGLPGNHHLYLTFKTHAPGVSAPADLLEAYPDEMTIVLQLKFWDLAPGETFFSVTLMFGGQPKTLSVPYAALTRFYDPSVQYILPFTVPEPEPTAVTFALAPKHDRPPIAAKPAHEPDTSAKGSEGSIVSDAPKIISLDQFRKK